MGFWDRDVENSFDRMFDLNRDGKLSPVEQGFQMEFIDKAFRNDMDEDDFDSDDF